MKKLFFTLCLASALASGTAQAQKAPKIATINMEVLFSKYQKAVEFEKTLKGELENFKKTDDARLKAIIAMREDTEKAQKEAEDPTKNEQARATARTVFENKARAFQNEQNSYLTGKRNSELAFQQRSQAHVRAVIDEIRPIVAALAKEKGADLVLNSTFNPTNVLYADPALEITDEVVKRLNATFTPAPPALPALPQVAPAN
ncbi:MAG: OmpH family outer membrane protein [Puniceicoccales bacterium]|nr:OmpH family outer membrane protein [Puniceicoccales bacterium]